MTSCAQVAGLDSFPASRIAKAFSKDRFDREVSGEEIKAALASEIAAILKPREKVVDFAMGPRPRIVLFVGVNGSGKTTTIGKIASKLAAQGALPEPRRGRVSRRVRSFPVTPRVALRPDERAQRWILSVSASDRTGLLYGIARVLARHRINLQLAKISTLGERVEDTFLIDGAELQHNRAQLAIESELLDALAPEGATA